MSKVSAATVSERAFQHSDVRFSAAGRISRGTEVVCWINHFKYNVMICLFWVLLLLQAGNLRLARFEINYTFVFVFFLLALNLFCPLKQKHISVKTCFSLFISNTHPWAQTQRAFTLQTLRAPHPDIFSRSIQAVGCFLSSAALCWSRPTERLQGWPWFTMTGLFIAYMA